MMTDSQFVTVTAAAEATGIPARTIRRWLSDGHMASVAGERGRLIDLADVKRAAIEAGHPIALGWLTAGQSGQKGHDGHVAGQDGREGVVMVAADDGGAAATLAALLRDKDAQLDRQQEVIERLTRDSVEMAGRLGFVMGQLEEARQTIRLLQAPASEPAPDDVVVEQAPAETASTTTPAPSAPDSGVQGPLRPWWRALWPWGRQPA